MATESSSRFATLKYALGPGLIMSAAAVGVSHLVQSTRAGAEYSFALIWAVLLANLFKYPFLEYGPRYAIATKESMIEGYKKLGNWAFWVFVVFTLGTMFTVQAAVTIVTASLAAELTGIALNPLLWSAIVLAICISILLAGQYSALDSAIKTIMVILTISTIIAIGVAIFKTDTMVATIEAPSIWNVAGVSFLIALMGWMPIPIDAAAWHSLWSLERTKQTGKSPSLKDGLFDFNIGYIGAGLLAVGFLSLGALVMFGSGETFAANGGSFAQQLVSMYTNTLGDWAYLIIIICAFTTMFSTTLTVTDAYPRVSRQIISVINPSFNASSKSNYRTLIIIISLVSLFALYITGSQFVFMVDLATTLSFLTAPIIAFINYRLVMSKDFPADFKPPMWLRVLSWSGILFLTGFALLYIYWTFAI
ncbi:Nramp family divalent metal transporter [Balneola vulgaris]|uniref:Nramp family divalent metal transporter n=1 Tax=Balneola vulgaris TaxID=287535 RepID=UPI00035E379E|nr:Nramp family divalent metal transporter [Balneola vulgaris]